MIIGYGGGVTVGAMTAFKEVEEIDCLEIEPAVVGAGPQFAEFNRKSYENPKVNIMYNDARNYMNVTRKQYDVIISEPSNPWIAGVASLFTSEFYERAAQVLKPDGVFAQWIQLYELDPRRPAHDPARGSGKVPACFGVGLFGRSDHHRRHDSPST